MSTLDGHTSFVVQPYRRKALRGYMELYSQDNLEELWDNNVADVLEEQGFDIPDSPRSVYRKDKLFEALDKYEPDKVPVVNWKDISVQRGLRFAHACMDKPKDHPYLPLSAFTPEFIAGITTNKKASAGLTDYGKVKGDSVIRAFDRGLQIIRGEKKPEPCIAYKRTQFNDKTRLVWGYPYSMTALEGLFLRPLIDQFKDEPKVMAFAMPDLILGGNMRQSSYHNKFCYVTDVSSFDSSINAGLIKEAFKSIRTWFDLNQIEPISGISYREIFDIVERYFIYTPIFMPDGNVYKGKKFGVPSGSYATQWVDTFVNVTQAGTASAHFHMEIKAQDVFALGDDMQFWSNKFVPYADLAKYLSDTFGCILKPEKGGQYHFSEPIKFLGRWWTNGIPDLEMEEILARMAQPESFRRYSRSKSRRAYEAQQLMLSFLTQYLSASQIYAKSYMNDGNRYCHTYSDYTRHCQMGLKHSEGESGLSGLDPNHLSGLQRYKLKYLDNNSSDSPVALQYWL
nr:MAG: putative RNA-dependent RNA polymerase [Partitiviridae sp.]